MSNTDLTKSDVSTNNISLDLGPGAGPGSTLHGVLGKGGEETWEAVVGSDVPLYVFSARTCLELLPALSNAQIDAEFKHLQALDASVHVRLTSKSTILKKREILHKSLADSLIKEVDKIVNKYSLFVENISRTVEGANKKIDAAQVYIDELQQRTTHTDTPHHPVSQLILDGNMEPPVSFSSISFSDTSYEDVEKHFGFEQSLPGNRMCSYYGAVEYSYGRIKHSPAEYPENNPVFDTLFSRLSEVDPTFTPANYSCLVTKYPDGNSSINMHQDNEKCILPGSKIYTVSFGAERHVRFYNVSGPLQEQYHKLTHGSVHIMTMESQSMFKHGIDREPDISGGRISFTFRHLLNPAQSTQRSMPTASIPQSPATSCDTSSKPIRVLLITDSIHASTPTHIFESLPKHVCIKRVEYQLANLDKYSSEFEYSDIVIISMGINDLHKYGHTARSLADCIGPRLKNYSQRFPHTKFIFNSLLLTRDFRWLNTEVRVFNQIIFELSRDTRNLSFFDSDKFAERKFAENSHIQHFYASGPRRPGSHTSMRDHRSNDGIHVCFEMRKLITEELVASVGYLTGIQGDRFRRCPWLRNVTTRSSWG